MSIFRVSAWFISTETANTADLLSCQIPLGWESTLTFCFCYHTEMRAWLLSFSLTSEYMDLATHTKVTQAVNIWTKASKAISTLIPTSNNTNPHLQKSLRVLHKYSSYISFLKVPFTHAHPLKVSSSCLNDHNNPTRLDICGLLSTQRMPQTAF